MSRELTPYEQKTSEAIKQQLLGAKAERLIVFMVPNEHANLKNIIAELHILGNDTQLLGESPIVESVNNDFELYLDDANTHSKNGELKRSVVFIDSAIHVLLTTTHPISEEIYYTGRGTLLRYARRFGEPSQAMYGTQPVTQILL